IWVMIHCATAPLPSTYMHLAQRSARSSYTLYLVHLPLVIFLNTLLHLPRAVPSWHVIAVSATLLFGVLRYAQLVYETFEKNTEKVRAWIKPHVISRPLGRIEGLLVVYHLSSAVRHTASSWNDQAYLASSWNDQAYLASSWLCEA
ncbi:MAG: hypothetical protein ACLGRW_00005, partial [Acidobacteriota bacterium]